MLRGPLEASVEVSAPVEAVWREVTDRKAMRRRSPELIGMWLFGPAAAGVRGVNLNRRKGFAWPTTTRITRWKPPGLDDGHAAFAFRVGPSGVEWSYELQQEGDHVVLTERRTALPNPGIVVRLTARYALGGAEAHDVELLDGMRTTLAGIKTAAEA